MKAIDFAGATHLPGPEGTFPLPVFNDPTGYYSFWKPDEKELAKLNGGAAIQLGIHHNVHPVVSLDVGLAEGPTVGGYSDETLFRVATAFVNHLKTTENPNDLMGALRAGLNVL